MKRSLPLIFAALMLLLPSTSLAQFYGPNGNGTLEHEDDLKWVIFHDAKITADNKRGVYTAKFGPDLAKMEGVQFSITGYMMLIEAKTTSTHFLITRRVSGCPFCPPNEPTEAIEVTTIKPFAYTQSPITVYGRLHLVGESAGGLFYQLKDARVG